MTAIQVNKYGTDVELNPIMRAYMENESVFFIIKVLLIPMPLMFLYEYKELKISKVGTWLLLAVYGALAIYHIYLNII